MSAHYVTVQWNKRKIVYDLVVVAAVLAYVSLFQIIVGAVSSGPRAVTSQIVDMRAWGTCAFLLVSALLTLGPLARLDRRFLPLLYNRRHLGIVVFLASLMHARAVTSYYYEYGALSRLEAVLTFDLAWTSASAPFQAFGMVAFAIFFVMAVTSHDFWQKFLGPRAWKSLHMSVYVAYASAVLHVALGALQFERHPVYVATVFASVVIVGGLHLAAARTSTRADRAGSARVSRNGAPWIDAGPEADFEDGEVRTVCPSEGERLAVVRVDGQIHAVHGVCAHQGGPLGEGKMVDGCLTCPWHGWQYLPATGASPPPFTEQLATHDTVVENGRVLVAPSPRKSAPHAGETP